MISEHFNPWQKKILFVTRVVMGWLFFYAGITKVLDPTWSAAGYLNNAKTFPSFYRWLATSSLLPITNFLNKWGLTLIGVCLILGLFVYLAGKLGALMMILYYFPVLTFPYIISAHAYIIDEHIIYALVLLLLAKLEAGQVYGLYRWCVNLPICQKYPNIRKLLG